MPDTEDGQVEPRATVDPAYVVVMDEQEETWYFPGSDRYFIIVKHPGLGEDRIIAAGAPGAAFHRTGKDGVDGSISMAESPSARFVQKCVEQVTDFCICIRQGGKLRDATYSDRGRQPGDNEYNRNIYTSLLKLTSVNVDGVRRNLRDEIEQVMDRVAGRTPEAEEDFEDLGERPGS